MPLQSAPAVAAADTPSSPRVPGRWLGAARVAVATVCILSLVLFVSSIPSTLRQEQTSADAATLYELGLSPRFWTMYHVTFDTLLTLGYTAIAAALIWRRSSDWMTLFVALIFSPWGVISTLDVQQLKSFEPLGYLLAWSVYFLQPTLVFLFFYLFPDGRFVPRWARTPFVVVTAATGIATLFPDSPVGHQNWPVWLRSLVWMGSWAAGLSAQIYRYRRVSNPLQRQQTKWVVYGLAVAMLGSLLLVAPVVPFPALNQPGRVGLLAILIARPIMVALQFLVPLSIAFSILRYRLWDIDLLINRTLVYGGLTASVVGIYVLIVGGIGALLQAHGNLAVSLLATGLVAVIFQPLRDRLQRGVNRLMYGERDEPYAVISRLGQRLEATIAPDAVLQTIVETVREALKLPYVAIALESSERRTQSDNGSTSIVASGTPTDHLIDIPLVYQHERVGELILAPRAPGETWSIADRRLLDDLARQAGVATHAVRLHTDLQHANVELRQSREHLITAREEERRRLRRDLHDGVGPTLASLSQRIDAARSLIRSDPDAATALLGDLKTQVKGTIADIRRLVYALRPPVLDEFGLVSAIKEHVASHNQFGGVRFAIEAPDQLPTLPAAVEVAAYRIVLEAITNVVRHAQAQICSIRLQLAGDVFLLEVIDDGVGLPDDRSLGIGIMSMRDRAAELGGECVIASIQPHGTRVKASLPLVSERGSTSSGGNHKDTTDANTY